MRKLFLSFVALVVLGTSAWAELTPTATNTVGLFKYNVPLNTLATEYSWKSGETYASFKIGNVTFSTVNTGTQTNGKFRNANTWCLYREYGGGPLTITADEDYWIIDLKLTYGKEADGVLSDKTNAHDAPQAQPAKYENNNTFTVNGQEQKLYVGRSTEWTKGSQGYLTFTNFAVTYCKVPTAISLSDMTVSVGNRFALLPEPTPADAYPSYTWTTDNADVVDINATTGVIEAKAAGEATITATSINGMVDSCTITVVSNDYKSFTDTIKAATTTNWSGQATADHWSGDGDVLKWTMRSYRRTASDVLATGGAQATRLSYNTTAGHVGENGIAYDSEYPLEGGVKRISFQWKAASNTNSVSFVIDNNGQPDGLIAYKTYMLPANANKSVTTYTRDLNMDKNVQLRLYIPDSEGTTITLGPLTITPYLLYTIKSMEKKQEEGSFTNTALINNAEGEVVYSVEGENADKIASINAATGEVTILGEGVVTVKAAWGDVYTTYTLIAHTKTLPKISFAADTINKDMLDAAFMNALTTSIGVGDTTYTSSNKQVATVAANGEVTIVGVGQTTITAAIAENATYAAASASYVLNVTFTPEEGTFWKETFSKRDPQKSKDGGDIATVGDSAVYNWVLNNYDYNTTDNFDGVIGVRVRYDGSIVNEFMEGGVKALAFQWRPSNASNYIHYTMAVGEDTTVFDSDPIQSINYTFARKYEQKSNTSFKFTIDTAGLKNTVAFLGVGPITVVPYLLYTQKNVTISKSVGDTYTNTALINNAAGDVVYTVEGGSEIATINAATGEVTIQGEGTVTVQATWGDVYTTYTLKVTGTTTSLKSVRGEADVQKVLINGHICIMRGARTYDLQGNLLR